MMLVFTHFGLCMLSYTVLLVGRTCLLINCILTVVTDLNFMYIVLNFYDALL